MKVACDGCAAKYSIEDDKVAGKTFKIRCRKCGRMLVLRGEPAAPPAEAASEAAEAVAPRWHAVRDGRQIGPFDSGELLRRRDAGELDDDSYVWREGLAEWQPLGTIDELRPAALQQAPAAAPPEPQAPAAPNPAPAAAPEPQAPATQPQALAAAAQQQQAPAAGRLRGERSETSALFTLSGLSKLGAPGAGTARAAAARGEGSGLIDVRALARSYEPLTRQGDGARPGAAGASSVGSAADLPVFPPAAFIAPGVLIPPVAPRSDRRLVVGLAAAFGLLAICATLLVVIALSRRGQPAIAGEQPAAPGPRVAANDRLAAPRATPPAVMEAPAAPGPASPAATPPGPAPATPGGEPPPPPPPSPQTRTPAPPVRAPSAPARAPAQVRAPASPSSPSARTPASPAQPPAPAAAKCDQVTCVVNGYDSECCRALRGGGGSLALSSPSPAASTLSENLDRAAITEGLATISTRRCSGAASATGLVKAHVKVSAAGAVTAVTVESSPDPALAACVVEQARQGRFKPTQRGGSFSYVWRF